MPRVREKERASAMRVVLDIETAPLPDVDDWLPKAEELEPPSNYKDPAKIAAWQQEKRAEMLAKAALDPDLCRVVCMAWLVVEYGDEDNVTVVALRPEVTELDYAPPPVAQFIGYNLLGFDLPIIQRRAWYLGRRFPPLNLDRYRSPHVDLMDILTCRGRFAARSLDFYCKRFGISDYGDTTKGKDIPALVAAGEWDKVEAHCRADVLKTRDLARKLGVL